ncbi:nuclease [Pseudomethylobacillus aquaticus]|uniref:Nuclease n=1 Tax=Pseudomethylobacillus aquaticus TaxID=2676064 RepID=A0A3N0V6P6_9PROT|nr:TIR domain-containing protein [Pseudomethylobacillus aquaticus]ROH88470.1 nuclease [Pseudomethylobacillus aquaticus]
MSLHQVHVFISHSWKYSEVYDKLEEWLFSEYFQFGQAKIDFRNYSVPKHDPIHNAANADELREAIYKQIAMSHVVVIPTGMYTTHSKWIQQEIDGANYYGKPILAVNPRGQERASGIVVDNSKKQVGWNTLSVAQSVWDLYYERI